MAWLAGFATALLTTYEALCEAIVAAVSTTPSYRPVDAGGAARAAAIIAELL